MIKIFAICSAVICFLSSASAEEATVQNVITAQISAFKKDDVVTAFTFASPKIQTLFGSPENFGQMVRKSYPMVWRPTEVIFVRQKAKGGTVYQEMQFFDTSGNGHSFVYEMIDIAGTWKINGLFKIKNTEVSA